MGNVIKGEELGSYRQTLQTLKSRLRGDLSQMTDEALRLDNGGGTGNLSNVPLHMADLGTDNYDQEFTLELIENEQVTLDLVNEALGRMDQGTYGQCVECGDPISKQRLQAIPYARHCIRCARKLEGGE
ncbi:MAG: TraR/DksA family transcriptional regulator [Isosphaeraceae bacterium]